MASKRIHALFATLFFKALAVSLHHVTHFAHFFPSNPHHLSMHLHHQTGYCWIISYQLQHHRHPSWSHPSCPRTTWHGVGHKWPTLRCSRSRRFRFTLLRIGSPTARVSSKPKTTTHKRFLIVVSSLAEVEARTGSSLQVYEQGFLNRLGPRSMWW